MGQNEDDKKLDWMYKGSNSLVDREEYLLGRSVDKSLEQLNAEERDKKLGILPPKNHVEHECIPPSIRDFNKIVQAEQVDLSAKLQEDPLMAIKKREEEARRQFLQNPVQLKKLQEALQAQQLKKKKKKKSKKSKASDSNSDSDLDRKIAKKLKYLKNDPNVVGATKKEGKKKSKDGILDTILMHKFNQLKDKLSQDDLNDILAGKVSSSDDEKEKKIKKHKRRKTSSSDNSDDENEKLKKKKSQKGSFIRDRTENKTERAKKIHRNRSSSNSSTDDEEYTRSKLREQDRREQNSKRSESFRYEKTYKTKQRINDRGKRRRNSSSDGNDKTEVEKRKERKVSSSEDDNMKHKKKIESTVRSSDKIKDADDDLENKILQRLRQLRDSVKSNPIDSSRKITSSENEEERTNIDKKTQQDRDKSSDSSSSDNDRERIQAHYDSDNDEYVEKRKAFGLVKSDGTKLTLRGKSYEDKRIGQTSKKVVAPVKPDRKNIKKLTEEEKEKLRKEMMKNAEKRDKERSENLRKYREEDEKEQTNSKNFDQDFMHRELLKSSKDATVETRIKSNLNNIQRSSRHMDSHFSRRK